MDAHRSEMIQRALKPWFVFQPWQVFRRLGVVLAPPPSRYVPLRTSWGVPVIANPRRTIGASIQTTGIFDLAVSEALARLISPGEVVADAGANVGYMTLLAALAAGRQGRVLAFEPHPDLFKILEQNASSTRNQDRFAVVETINAALGDRTGSAFLHCPPSFEFNDGISKLGNEPHPEGQSTSVRVTTLDEALGTAVVSVLKMDVEGFEPQVLRGARNAMAERRVKHILFEDHDAAESETCALLREQGYRIFSIGWSLRGPRLQPVERGILSASYEAPSFVATLDPEQVHTRMQPFGWKVLRPHLGIRSPLALQLLP